MACCCYLLSGRECLEPTSDDELNRVLQEVRDVTGRDWRVRETRHEVRRWFRSPRVVYRYELLYHLWSVEFQSINFYRPDLDSDWSINIHVPAGFVVAYLYGVLSSLSATERRTP